MKKFTFMMIAAIFTFVTAANVMAQTAAPAIEGVSRIEGDTTEQWAAGQDSISVSDMEGSRYDNEDWDDDFDEFMNKLPSSVEKGIKLAALIMILLFMLPIVILLIVLYFRQKDKNERYRLMEEAIKHGQPTPDFDRPSARKERATDNYSSQKKYTHAPKFNYEVELLYSKGIKHIVIGVALFIFMYALTDEFGVACCSLFIIAFGVEKLLRYRKFKQLEEERWMYEMSMRKEEEENRQKEEQKSSEE